MRLAAALVIVLTLSVTLARAEQGVPSSQTLADMRLSGLEIISDSDAMSIRGSGFNPGESLSGFADFQQHKLEFKQRVAEFQGRIDSHVFTGAASFQKNKAAFQNHVNKFHAKVH